MITGAHAKAPSEMLYLETGEMEIPSVMSVRRLMYWHNIIRRHKKELISQVYHAMKNNPMKGDWIHLVESDLQKINMKLEHENQVAQLKKETFKKIIKAKIIEVSFEKMEKLKQSHSKVKHLSHCREYKIQEYMMSNKATCKISKLIMRSNCVKGFQNNFRNQYSTTKCPMCEKHDDSQELAMSCEVVKKHINQSELIKVKYENLYGNVEEQVQFAQVFQKIIKLREAWQLQDLPTGASIPDPVANIYV